jgi:hypothetical protein
VRPRYRVLAAPWYDHDHSGRYPADRCAPAGYELEVYRDDGVRHRYRPLGVTRTTSGGTLDAREVRALVLDWLRARAAPRASGAAPADVELYARLDDAP